MIDFLIALAVLLILAAYATLIQRDNARGALANMTVQLAAARRRNDTLHTLIQTHIGATDALLAQDDALATRNAYLEQRAAHVGVRAWSRRDRRGRGRRLVWVGEGAAWRKPTTNAN